MALPPLHRVDHEVVIVLNFDGAWDQDRLNSEIAAIKDPKVTTQWPGTEDHPWIRYMRGVSRGDLATVQEYLDEGEKPVRFLMRRLTLKEIARIRADPSTSKLTALSYALTDVVGATVAIDRGGREPPHALTDADMQRLRELVGDDGIVELGEQAMACSRELLEVEKKP